MTKQDRRDIDPCPFCGESSDFSVLIGGAGGVDDFRRVRCNGCRIDGPPGMTAQQAIARFNDQAAKDHGSFFREMLAGLAAVVLLWAVGFLEASSFIKVSAPEDPSFALIAGGLIVIAAALWK